MQVLTEFEKEVGRSRYKSLNELRTSMDLSWLRKKDYRVITLESQFDLMFEEMQRYTLFGFDTETTGLNIYNLSEDNPLRDKLVGICLSWKRNQGVYLPFEHTRFKNLDKSYVLRNLRPFLETHDLVAHNGLYDAKVMYQEGIIPNIVHDTRILYFNLDSNVSRGSKGLKPLSEKMYGYPIIEFDDIFASSKDYGLFRELPEDIVQAYACADPDHTLQLFLDSFGYLSKGQRRSYALDIKLQRELTRSEYCGKGVNMELCRAWNDYRNRDLATLSSAIFRYAHYLVCKKKNIPYSPNEYCFNISSSDELAHLFYDLLGYEVLKVNEGTGAPSVDKFVLKSMLREEDPGLDEFEENLIARLEVSALAEANFEGFSSKELELVNKKKFRSYKYKMPYLIQVWRKLEKDRTSFFAKLLDNNYEGRFFSDISQTGTQTARLTDFIQTLVGGLKYLITPFDTKKQYFIDFDFAQIEYRVMAGLSGIDWLVERLKDSEADFHREGGKIIVNKEPEDITKEERSNLKSVNFGIPYGMSASGIMQNRYGVGLPKEEQELRTREITQLLRTWNERLYQIADMLNKYRKMAITQVSDERLALPLKGKKLGIISNPLGRTRVFYLEKHNGDDIEDADIHAIERQAGNFPIQSYAADIYKLAIIKLNDALRKEGLIDIRVPDDSMPSGYRLENKCVIIAYIHDECLMCVDKDVSPNLIQKLIYENCMIELQGHPNYYCGINVIENWHEGKSDIYEAPVGYVQWVVQNLDQLLRDYDPKCRQRDYVLAQIKDYLTKRIAQEICKFTPEVFDTYVLDTRKIVPKFKNYFVKPKMADFFPVWRETLDSKKPNLEMYKDPVTRELFANAGLDYDDYTTALLESYLLQVLDKFDVIYPNGYKRHFVANDKPRKLLQSLLIKEAVEEREEQCLEEDTEVITDESQAVIVTNLFATVKQDMQNEFILHL